MSTTLGSVTFDTEEISSITWTKSSGITVMPLTGNDSDQTQTVVLDGANMRITIRGNVYKSSTANCQTRYNTLLALITGAIGDEPIDFQTDLMASAIKVVVEMVELNQDANTLPIGHFSFSINLLQTIGMGV